MDISTFKRSTKSHRMIIINKNLMFHENLGTNVILVENPDLVICLIGKLFSPKILPSIHESAIIHPEAEIHDSCFIGANVCINKNVIIRRNVIIDENCVIKNCHIDEGAHIHPGVKIGSAGLGSHRDGDETAPISSFRYG